MATNDKTDAGATPAGNAGNAAAKTETTASAKAIARKKQQQQQQTQKNQKATTNAEKKKQPHVAKSKFEGIASGVNPMKGIVIAQGNGNLAGQFRVYQEKMAGSAADDKAYGLDSSILDLVAKVKSDFVKPKPSPLSHSNLVDIMVMDENGKPTSVATGERRLICYDPILKDEMEAEYNMDLKIQKSNWNQFERHYEGYYRTAVGNVEDTIMTYCRADKRMALVERKKDLVGFLLILRSVCAQNNNAVKIDEEYQNLHTLHAAVGFKQEKSVSNSKFSHQVIDRYGSAIFTCGKFVFGQMSYDKVLSNLSTPITFAEYVKLPESEQSPIDELVKQRTVARLIVKNSLNKRLREHLVTAYSTTKDECYPNTISDALSLLSTFAKQGQDTTPIEAVVSYHESTSDVIQNDESTLHEEINSESNNEIIESVDDDKESNTNHVSFNEHVMAAIISEASSEADVDQFFGASFSQLQDVDDVYHDDEPDKVCCAHIIDTDDDNIPPTTTERNPHHDFELIMYLTSQRVNNKGDVRVVHYERGRPDLISHEYSSPCAESIIDYADAIRLKLKLAGIHDSNDLMTIFEDRNVIEASAIFKAQLNDVEQTGLKTSTVRLLKEETIRHIAHRVHNSIRYDQMIDEIGVDDEPATFPQANVLLHHTISAVSINQRRHKPNRWVNKVTLKLVNCGITTIELLESKLQSDTLNDHIHEKRLPRLHQITIYGFRLILGMEDFCRGRS
jgi:hypothetical protein